MGILDLELFFIDKLKYRIEDVNSMIYLDFMMYFDRYVAMKSEELDEHKNNQDT
jgi:hypothetical protein